jgi:DNA (cytosine-5-)-methyltransferase
LDISKKIRERRKQLLLQGDCLNEMSKVLDSSVDLILVDLPYGTSACSWDVVIPMEKLWEQYLRVLKPNGTVVLFGSEPFSSLVRSSNLEMYKYDWKWVKPRGANFLNAKYQPMKNYEDIMVFSRCPASYSRSRDSMVYNPIMGVGEPYKLMSGKQKLEKNNSTVRSSIKSVVTDNKGLRYPKATLEFKSDKDKLHPTQKPVDLLEYLIRTYTVEGMVVLDSCMGSGSTGVACKNLNRSFIGIELDEGCFEIAKQRINGS